MGGNIVDVAVVSGFVLLPAVSGGGVPEVERRFGMLLGPEGTSSPQPPLGGAGVLVSSVPGAGPALTSAWFLVSFGGLGFWVFGGWWLGFVGWWVFVNWIVDASIL